MGSFIKEKKYASIEQVKFKKGHNDNCVRVYCRQKGFDGCEDAFNFQIRTHKPIGEFGKGVPRDMVATVSLTPSELKEILKYVEEYRTGD